jgi:hypothetical protein
MWFLITVSLTVSGWVRQWPVTPSLSVTVTVNSAS